MNHHLDREAHHLVAETAANRAAWLQSSRQALRSHHKPRRAPSQSLAVRFLRAVWRWL